MRVLWAAVILLGATGSVRIEAAETIQVNVFVQKGNWPRSVSVPEQLAADLFGKIGVHVNWHLGKLPAGPCAAQKCIGIQLVEHPPVSATPGGLASARPYGAGGTLISVYADRVHALIANLPSLSDIVVAYIFAHELAHVMMASDYHSEAGVLKAQWSYADYAAMGTRQLAFTSRDADRIRGGMVISLAAR